MPYLFTDRSHGDLRLGSPGADGRRRAVVDLPWVVPDQVHGDRVLVVDAATGPARRADALVTATPGIALSVGVADCAPIALLAEADGVVGVVHAGWRGLVEGVIPAALDAMRALGATDVDAVLGPCIHPECYEWQPADLDAAATRLGDEVRGTTSWGTPALDLPAAVRLQLPGVVDESVCTACSSRHWSHRARGDRERQAVVAWI